MAVSLAPQDFQLPFSSSPMDPQQPNQNGPRTSPATVQPSGTATPRQDPPVRSATPSQNDSNASGVNVPFVPYSMSSQQWPNPPQAAMPPHPSFPYPAFGYFTQQPSIQGPFPTYDASQQSQQLAQWAYQQMMFNAAQQQQMAAAAGFIPRQRTGSAPQHPSEQVQTAFYHGMPSSMMVNGFQSPSFGHSQTGSSASLKGTPSTEPYRRNHGSSSPSPVSSPTVAGLPQAAFPPLQAAQPPYARERNGSATSVNSSGGSSRSVNNSDGRRRTVSTAENTKSSSPHRPTNSSASSSQPSSTSRSRSPAPHTMQTRSASPEPSKTYPSTHQRGSSTASSSSSATQTRALSTTSSASNASSSTTTPSSSPQSTTQNGSSARSVRGPPKPSPLSQQSTVGDNNKRVSRDDSGLTTPLPEVPGNIAKTGGLKGRLRRALSFSAGESLSEAENEASTPRLGSRRQVVAAKNAAEQKEAEKKLKASGSPSGSTPMTQSPAKPLSLPIGDEEELEAPDPSLRSTKKKGRSLFNRKFNASTDNISLSSTVSSASLMIRKIGSVGAMARRKSLAGITGLFKDKDKKNKSKKGGAAEPDLSLVNAELDRDLPGLSPEEMAGLSPAAKLARQHTLRSNAEAAARVKVKQEANSTQSTAPGSVPTWERDTARREVNSPLRVRGNIDESGRRLSAHSRSYSDDGSEESSSLGHVHQHFIAEENDFLDQDDEDLDDGEVTVRHDSFEMEVEPWAVGVRRSIERTRMPSRGILRNGSSYNQENDLVLSRSHSLTRNRSNSCDTVSPHHHIEPGPLARISSSDPDHIDGLQPHESHGALPFSKFSGVAGLVDSPSSSPPASPATAHEKSVTIGIPHHGNMPYMHPKMNSSAPTLSIMHPEMAPRSKTTPVMSKRIAFAANLSVYDTFSPLAYDRRSEPATCNQLTPALAQRIKEELNAYKMEEMEVHHASRAHTQFFV